MYTRYIGRMNGNEAATSHLSAGALAVRAVASKPKTTDSLLRKILGYFS